MKIKFISLMKITITFTVLCGIYFQIANYNMLAKLAILLCGGLTVLLYYCNRGFDNKMLNIWMFMTIFMLFTGLFQAQSWPEHLLSLINMDLSTVVCIAVAFVLADAAFDDFRNKLFLGIVTTALVCGLVALFTFDLSSSMLTDRYMAISANHNSYILWGMLCNIFAFAGYSAIFSKKGRLLKIAAVLLYVVLGLLFQKRSVLVNAFIMVILFFIHLLFSGRRKSISVAKLSKIIIAIFLVVVIIVVAVNTSETISALLDSTLARLDKMDVSDYNRTQEGDAFVEASTPLELLLGHGIGNYFIDHEGVHGMLHIGYYNALYKGGIIYLLFLCYIMFKTFQAFGHRKELNETASACLYITISMFVSMTFEFSWSESILPLCYMPFTGYLCMLKYPSVRNARTEVEAFKS